jgi:pimeloyl-ACP methyl ester carboxylesterase/DNA-binding CsgD family transcriptional regulator
VEIPKRIVSFFAAHCDTLSAQCQARQFPLTRPFVDDYDSAISALVDFPDEFSATVAQIADQATGGVVDLTPGSFASAACDAHGKLLAADQNFWAWLQGPDPLSAVVRNIRSDRPHVAMVADDATGRPIAIAAGSRTAVANWPLDPAIRAILESGGAAFAAIAFRPNQGAWRRVAEAFGFTSAEARLVSALATTGDLKRASSSLDIAYDTARKLVASAMEKTSSPRQADLVRKVLTVAAGDMTAPSEVTRLFADLFGLTLKQAQLARGIALGATRNQAAAAIPVSTHRAKADLKAAFAACGVANAVELARIVAEVDVLAGLALACDVELNLGTAAYEPLRLIRRSWARGRIAVADHGPTRGQPLVIFHTMTMGRSISRRFVKRLQAAGFRPILFERAGFGLSDAVDGEPHISATRDLIDVLDTLGITQATLLSRGGNTAVVNAAATLLNRIVGGVLLGAGPPVSQDRKRKGMLGFGKSVLFDNPHLLESFAKLMFQRTNSSAIRRIMLESVKGSASDVAALADEQEMATVVRATRQCALGMKGFVGEIVADVRHTRPPTLIDADKWTVITGAQDQLFQFNAEAETYWRTILPNARFVTVPDGGRFLHLTHPEAIVSALLHCRK